MIEAAGLAIGYPGRIVAAGIDLAVRPGEILCLLGPNGSGKTTLFRTLLGLLPPLAGEVRIGGAPLARLGHAMLARSLAYVPQQVAGAFSYSVADMVLMGRTAHLGLFGTPRAGDHAAALAALQALGIAHLADADTTRISGGQRQLALIARALAQEASAMILDEPTASLDFGNRLRVLAELRRIAGRGIAVILSTHEPDQALALADRVLVLADGAVLAAGQPAVLTAAVLSRAYGTDVVIEPTRSGRLVVLPSPADQPQKEERA